MDKKTMSRFLEYLRPILMVLAEDAISFFSITVARKDITPTMVYNEVCEIILSNSDIDNMDKEDFYLEWFEDKVRQALENLLTPEEIRQINAHVTGESDGYIPVMKFGF